MRAPMRQLLPPILALAALAVAGCGGGGGGGGGDQAGGSPSPPPASPTSTEINGDIVFDVTTCLDAANWQVQPGPDFVGGSSERGVTYLVTFYPSSEAAKAKAGKNDIVVESAVVQLNPAGSFRTGGDAPNVKPTTEADTIKGCIEESG